MSEVRSIPELDSLLTEAVASQDLPFVVAMLADSKGVLWQGSAGLSSVMEAVDPDPVFRIYSQTKAIGAAAALILVDRGLLSLDTVVASVVPEFAEVRLLDSIGPDGPVLRAPRVACTLRHLLTHTSGLVYEGMDDRMTAYRDTTGRPVVAISSMETLLDYPMVFEPGEGFAYGVSMDWVGLIIQRVDGRTIDRFCREEIFEPLGMVDTDFEPDRYLKRIPRLNWRNTDGGFFDVDLAPPAHPEFYGLGICLYSTASDYIRFLRMVLGGGQLDGRRILSEQAIELMMTNQMPNGLRAGPIVSSDHNWADDIDFFPGTHITWTAAFLRNEEDIPGRRAAGSLAWAGIFNSHYWIDPTNDLAVVFMTQSLPFVEPRVMARVRDFERTVYQHLPAWESAGRHRERTT